MSASLAIAINVIADLAHPYRRPRVRWGRQRRVAALAIGVLAGTLLFLLLLAGVAYGGSAGGTERLVVQPGDTVWTIAASHYHDTDLRSRIDAILTGNHMASPVLVPGQQLTLPPP